MQLFTVLNVFHKKNAAYPFQVSSAYRLVNKGLVWLASFEAYRQILKRPTSICKCVPNRASSTLDAAVSSLAADV
jgi:hypothetical protein